MLGTIDLSALNQSTHPKSKTKEEKKREREQNVQRKDVEVGNPPDVESVDRADQHHSDESGDHCLYAEHKRVDHDEHSHRVNVRKRFKSDL